MAFEMRPLQRRRGICCSASWYRSRIIAPGPVWIQQPPDDAESRSKKPRSISFNSRSKLIDVEPSTVSMRISPGAEHPID